MIIKIIAGIVVAYLVGTIVALFLTDRAMDKMSKEELLEYDMDSYDDYLLQVAICSWYVVWIYYQGWVHGFWEKMKEEIRDDDNDDDI
jgi:hypothetical protein